MEVQVQKERTKASVVLHLFRRKYIWVKKGTIKSKILITKASCIVAKLKHLFK